MAPDPNTKKACSSVGMKSNHINNQYIVFVVNSAKFSNFLFETKSTIEYYYQLIVLRKTLWIPMQSENWQLGG